MARLLNRDLSLDARAARGGALLSLAADLPASVLADLLGLSIAVALRWGALAARDQGVYLAARLDDDKTPMSEVESILAPTGNSSPTISRPR